MSKQPPSTLADFCRSRHIRRLAVFGSTLRGTTGADSDVDLLVEFEAGETPGLIALSTMELELSAFFGGKKIDLRTPNDLSRHFREEVQRTAELRYAV
jgi:predicted nucleotidyltransferase